LSRFQVQTVGGAIHTEYWIPAEELPEFNANIVGMIEVIEEFRLGSDKLKGNRDHVQSCCFCLCLERCRRQLRS
jgi:hypothetical protein